VGKAARLRGVTTRRRMPESTWQICGTDGAAGGAWARDRTVKLAQTA
jgi:hypothetical protein